LRAEPARLMEIDDLTPLPSAEEPSDHLAILATFRKAWSGWKKRRKILRPFRRLTS